MTMPRLAPLLEIAAGRKPRRCRLRAPAPREIKLHVPVANLLRDHCLPEWKWTHINRTAKDARQGKIFRDMGVNPHWPDFILVSPHGSVRFLELKRAGKDLEEGQEEFRLWCIAHGAPHVTASTMDHVLAAFSNWGCIRIVVPLRREASP